MNKLLGQHFLINQAAIQKIIAAADLQSQDTVIEIGPGRGALTFPLLKKCEKIGCKVIGIEKDPILAKKLSENYQLSINNFQMITEDILKILPDLTRNWKLGIKNWKLVGNIPYYITGKLLRVLSELKNKPKLIILMIQKEVAERICAQPPKMNLLAAAVQFWAEPKILFTLKSTDFTPPPKVNSAVIQLIPRPKRLTLNAQRYYALIHIAFKQPRKTLVNNLGIGLKSAGWRTKNKIENALKKAGIDPSCRPQNLSLNELKLLTTLLL